MKQIKVKEAKKAKKSEKSDKSEKFEKKNINHPVNLELSAYLRQHTHAKKWYQKVESGLGRKMTRKSTMKNMWRIKRGKKKKTKRNEEKKLDTN